ncbi:MAG: acyl-CoA dehydrogenase family protein [Planctomycetes bacterium]|nr:acyl-CoA dehydrogenase family protein [Planctomycetota bacterium]
MADNLTGPLSEEQTLLLETIRKFADETVAPGAAARDLERAFPADLWEGIAELGLAGVPYPEAVGGVGMGFLTHALVLEELARACASTAMTVVAHTNLALGAIVLGGSTEQHARWAEPLAAGDPLGALVLGAGELAPGPALGGVTARAAADGHVLHGSADWVMNGSRAGTLVVLAATDPAGRTAGLFVVPGDAPGLVRGAPIHTMGLRAMDIASVRFEDVRVPQDAVLGDPAGGLANAQRTLDAARVALGAVNVGIARAALDRAATFSRERIAFGKPIATFDGSREKFALMATSLESARQTVYAAARAQDAGGDFTNLAIAAQLEAGRAVLDVGFEALQLLGGYGYCHEYDVERYCRDAKMCEVGFDELALVKRRLARSVVGL